MPQYTFYCQSCNLQFKCRLKMGDHKIHKCASCKGEAKRVLQGFGFDFAQTAATKQANSGVTKHDYPTADNIVGRSAEEKWDQIYARNVAKDKFRQETGAVALSRKDTVESGQIVTEYKPLHQTQFDARKKQEVQFKEKARKDGIQTQSIPEKAR